MLALLRICFIIFQRSRSFRFG